MTLTIRKGTKQDIPAILMLVKELAKYEKALNEVENSPEKMEKELFDSNADCFGCIVAEKNEIIIGISIYYYRYSTWKGKRLYLEDIIVTQKERGRGTGKLLFEETIQIAKKLECSGLTWQVLDWNEDAIHFYKKYPSRFDKGWINCNLDF